MTRPYCRRPPLIDWWIVAKVLIVAAVMVAVGRMN